MRYFSYAYILMPTPCQCGRWIEILGLVIAGGLFGSFANLLIYRLPRHEDIVVKRSRCIHCEHKLDFLDLVPVISYLVLFGKCRFCKAHIPLRYLLCELFSISIFVGCWFWFGHTYMFYKSALFLFSMLLIFFIDLEHHIIPDIISVPLIVIGLSAAFFEHQIIPALIGILIGFSVLMGIGFIARLYYKKPALGFGDVKLMMAVGAFWGIQTTILTLYFSFILGGFAGVLLLLTRLRKRHDYIAFGPAIIAGFCVALFFGDLIARLYLG